MVETARLSIRVDSDGVTRADRDLGRLETQGGKTARATDGLTRSFRLLGGVLAAAGIAGAVKGSINSFAEFERGLIGVGKTTDITGAALDDLGQRIRELSRDVPVAASELLEIAQSAGQLGVNGADNILRFTETVGKLGLASDLAGEQAATSLARILTVTGTAISDVDRLGATIVQLGNNFAATESEIAHVATRVSQATAQFDVSAAEVLGISTALKAVGVEAEAGGTQVGLSFQAINDALRNGGEEMELLQQVTGRTGDALREDFFDGNSARVFQDFINGLGKIQSSGGDVASALGAMGLNGVRATQVLGTLSTRTDVLADAMAQANREWESNLALNKEAAIASESFSAQLQLVKSAADEAASAVGSIIAPAALDGLDSFRDASLYVAENIETLTDVATVLAVLMAGRLVGATAAATAGIVTQTAAALKGTATMNIYTGALVRTTGAQVAMAGASRAGAASLALIGGPVGAAVIAASALFHYVSNLESATEASERLSDSVASQRIEFEGLVAVQAKHLRNETSTKIKKTKENLEDLEFVLEDATDRLEYLEKTGWKFDKEGKITRGKERIDELNNSIYTTRQTLTSLRGDYEKLGRVISGQPLLEEITVTAKRIDSDTGASSSTTADSEPASGPSTGLQDQLRGTSDILGQIQDANAAAFRATEQSLKTEEEKILESYQRRRDIILVNTAANSEAQRNMLERLNDDFAGSATDGFGGEDNTHKAQLQTVQDQFAERLELVEANTRLEEERKTEIIAELTKEREAQVSAIEGEQAQMRLRASAQLFDGLAGLTKTFGDEQSGLYKTLFAASKAFAIAESVVAIQTGIAKASDLDFPANIAAMATVASQTAGLVSTIRSTSLDGVAHGGLDNVPKESTYLLDKGERVLSPNQNKDLTSFLQGNGGGAQSVNIKVVNDGSLPVMEGRAEMDDQNNIRLIVRAVKSDISNDISNGRGLAKSFEQRYSMSKKGVV